MVHDDHDSGRANASTDGTSTAESNDNDSDGRSRGLDDGSRSRRGVLKGLGVAAAAAVAPTTAAHAQRNAAPPVRVRLGSAENSISPDEVLTERTKTSEDFVDVGNDPVRESFETGVEMGKDSLDDEQELAAYVRTTRPDGMPISVIGTTRDGSFEQARERALKKARSLTDEFGTEMQVSTPTGEVTHEAADIDFTPDSEDPATDMRSMGGGTPINKKPDGTKHEGLLTPYDTCTGGSTEMLYWMGHTESTYDGRLGTYYQDFLFQTAKVLNVPDGGWYQYDPFDLDDNAFTLSHDMILEDGGSLESWQAKDYEPGSDPPTGGARDVDLSVDSEGGGDAEFTLDFPDARYKDKSDPARVAFAGRLLYNYTFGGDETISYTVGNVSQISAQGHDPLTQGYWTDPEDVIVSTILAEGWFEDYYSDITPFANFAWDVYLDGDGGSTIV